MKILIFTIIYLAIGLVVNYVTNKTFDRFGRGIELDGLGLLITLTWPAILAVYVYNMIK